MTMLEKVLIFLFIRGRHAHQHDAWREGEFFRIHDIRAEEFRGEVRYITEYDGDELWNITMKVKWRVGNFNPQQSKLEVRNVTENDSAFVMVPYDQDRVVTADKPARFGFQGMFDPKLKMLEDGTFDIPHMELVWMMNTANETTFYDSEIGYTEPETTTAESTTLSMANSTDSNGIPTVSLVGKTEVLNRTEDEGVEPTKRPWGWSAPEPDYVKFKLPFNSPHGSKFAGFDFNYGEALKKSIIFFEAQRSGVLPESNRIPWRSDSFILDRGSMKEDLSRGYFDAGDHLKFTLPMAFSMTLLSWSLLQYWDSYDAIGELDNALDQIKWGVEWLVRANPRKNEMYALVGDPKIDHDYWGRPENFTAHRPTFKITTGSPGSDVAGETAAAMAAASLVLKRWGDESTYPGNLAKRAELLYQFANEHRRHYHLSVPAAAKHYKSSGYKDELVWAATWVYRATGKSEYLINAHKHYAEFGMKNSPMGFRFSWDDKTVGTSILLAQVVDDARRQAYLANAEQYCDDIRSERKVLYTPGRLLYLDEWGPIRYAMNSASICLMVSDLTSDVHAAKRYHKWAQSQVDYVLGAKSNGYSYMVGYGTKYPRRPHHRAASCPLDMSKVCDYSFAMEKDDNPSVHWGAVVGGPDRHDGYKDDRLYYKQSEVALDFNAGFQLATSGVLYHSLFGKADEIYKVASAEVKVNVTTTEAPTTLLASSAFVTSSSTFVLFISITVCF